jgi:hypothetical protein
VRRSAGRGWHDRWMIPSVIYWAPRRLVELLVLRRWSDDGKEVEILSRASSRRWGERAEHKPVGERAMRPGDLTTGVCSFDRRRSAAGIGAFARADRRTGARRSAGRQPVPPSASSWCGSLVRTRPGLPKDPRRAHASRERLLSPRFRHPHASSSAGAAVSDPLQLDAHAIRER